MPLEQPQPEESFGELHSKSLLMAQVMSHKWRDIPADATWQADYPELAGIYYSSSKEKGGRTGIQAWFEEQIKFNDSASGGNEEIKRQLMRRTLEKLEELASDLDTVIKGYK